MPFVQNLERISEAETNDKVSSRNERVVDLLVKEIKVKLDVFVVFVLYA